MKVFVSRKHINPVFIKELSKEDSKEDVAMATMTMSFKEAKSDSYYISAADSCIYISEKDNKGKLRNVRNANGYKLITLGVLPVENRDYNMYETEDGFILEPEQIVDFNCVEVRESDRKRVFDYIYTDKTLRNLLDPEGNVECYEIMESTYTPYKMYITPIKEKDFEKRAYAKDGYFSVKYVKTIETVLLNKKSVKICDIKKGDKLKVRRHKDGIMLSQKTK